MVNYADPTKLTQRRYFIYAGSPEVNLGYVDDAECTLTKLTRDRKVQHMMEQVLGTVIVGIDGRVKCLIRQVTVTNIARAFPWYTGSGSIALAPTTLGGDLYDYAVKLRLHPQEIADGTHDQDINLLKCASIGPAVFKQDVEKDAVIPLEFRVYPDRAQLPSLVLGYVGDVPA